MFSILAYQDSPQKKMEMNELNSLEKNEESIKKANNGNNLINISS